MNRTISVNRALCVAATTLAPAAVAHAGALHFDITGNGASNTAGIEVNTGNLVLENSDLKQLSTGLVGATHEDVIKTNFVGNTLAMQSTATRAG